MAFVDLVGRVYGRLTVIEYAGRSTCERRRPLWRCSCNCGGTKVVLGENLAAGHTQSCGCLHREINRKTHTTHGKSTSPTYRIYKKMIARCYNANTIRFECWGGRGITVCDRWRNSFEAFLEDMGERPSKAHSIDRVDNDGNYEPGNCRWATREEQAGNKRPSSTARRIEYGGESLRITAWANRYGMPYHVLYSRLKKGWPMERALNTPVRRIA